MKKGVFFLTGLLGTLTLCAQQVVPPRVAQMPDAPSPYFLRNWSEVALHYDTLVFDLSAAGDYMPLMRVEPEGFNYNHEAASMASYVGQTPEGGAEAINYLPALVGASLCGIDKSDQNGYNWVRMAEQFFNRSNQEYVYLNNYNGRSGHDWWYETMPNIFFYQLNACYPHSGNFDDQFISVANQWLAAVIAMGGSATPWSVPYMNYRAWDLKKMEPLESGVKQPAASGAIAWILYHAFLVTGVEEYRIGAEWAMEFLDSRETNPVYELQLAYGVYTAARMNAELGTIYDLDQLMTWCFDRGSLRGWGIILGRWGAYDCYGLRGEANDQGDDYAFFMNGIQQAAALLPAVRYQEQYANAIGKWMLHLVHASRFFYPGFLPPDHQDHADWAEENDPHQCVAHEAMKETLDQKSPYATGDAVRGGWAPTNLALYGSSHVGYLGAMVDQTNIDQVLKLDLCCTDFYASSYPTYLIWNPHKQDTSFLFDAGLQHADIYDSRANQVIAEGVAGKVEISLPAQDSRILVCLPENANLTSRGKKTMVEGKVIDFDNGTQGNETPPRIKALVTPENMVEVNDSLDVFCTVSEPNQSGLTYHWWIDDQPVEGDEVLSLVAPGEEGWIEIACVVLKDQQVSDTARLKVEVKQRIPHVPEIISLTATPRKLAPLSSGGIQAVILENNGDTLSFSWKSSGGSVTGDGPSITWNAPGTPGNYTIYCTVSDRDGACTDSIICLVRPMDNLYRGEPVLYLPFNNHANDRSGYGNETASFHVDYDLDRTGREDASAVFNGTTSWVEITNADWLNFTGGLTAAGWIYPLHEGAGEAYIFSHGSWENRWKISLSRKTLRGTVNTTEGIRDLDASSEIHNETWTHFALVYTGNDLELYLNGKLDAFTSQGGQLRTTSFDLAAGKARPDQDYHYAGRLDDLTLYDHALAPGDIQWLFEKEVSIPPLSPSGNGLVSLYPNPVHDRLHLSLENFPAGAYSYKLTTISGLTLREGTHHVREGSLFTLQTQQIKSGMYVFHLYNSARYVVRKILIVH